MCSIDAKQIIVAAAALWLVTEELLQITLDSEPWFPDELLLYVTPASDFCSVSKSNAPKAFLKKDVF